MPGSREAYRPEGVPSHRLGLGGRNPEISMRRPFFFALAALLFVPSVAGANDFRTFLEAGASPSAGVSVQNLADGSLFSFFEGTPQTLVLGEVTFDPGATAEAADSFCLRISDPFATAGSRRRASHAKAQTSPAGRFEKWFLPRPRDRRRPCSTRALSQQAVRGRQERGFAAYPAGRRVGRGRERVQPGRFSVERH